MSSFPRSLPAPSHEAALRDRLNSPAGPEGPAQELTQQTQGGAPQNAQQARDGEEDHGVGLHLFDAAAARVGDDAGLVAAQLADQVGLLELLHDSLIKLLRPREVAPQDLLLDLVATQRTGLVVFVFV